MNDTERLKRSRFERNLIAIPYIIFGIIIALVFIFSPIPVVLVTFFAIFTVYTVIAMFIAFLFKYGRTTLYLLVMTLCMSLAVAFLLYMMFKMP
ncbi:hypothetical protein DOS77_09690 [Staphylococcus felis]|uniref:hypothetical protein n=1 Tax=Staphylococcus felis TaxID=46127 RepID=UPI000E235D0C|nr:hypothetical protein [Staphylococcus felis]REH75279.1 hypothetical protein DOS57_10055 [Staphylococcus felis]REI01892.1 hypothetical protein DOS65_06575 [Staphylococcus felis]REI12480.1 hypothetical protein DOS66_02255 [Staphylococcus felis]REI20522.1 hypothetical protein DOS77_09690 [Staphylococcus felis]REI24325.1 hypothetical protein DOS78_05050 [Staphylococcus felis]